MPADDLASNKKATPLISGNGSVAETGGYP
jgi:hypothetical protein